MRAAATWIDVIQAIFIFRRDEMKDPETITMSTSVYHDLRMEDRRGGDFGIDVTYMGMRYKVDLNLEKGFILE